MMCHVLKVSRSGYYAWRRRVPTAREMADSDLQKEIKEIFAASKKTYGSPRVHTELRVDGIRVSRKRVERLMRENGLKVPCKLKKRVVTTDPDHNLAVAPNLLERESTAASPNEKGSPTSATFEPTPGGCIWQWSWFCFPGVLLVGRCVQI